MLSCHLSIFQIIKYFSWCYNSDSNGYKTASSLKSTQYTFTYSHLYLSISTCHIHVYTDMFINNLLLSKFSIHKLAYKKQSQSITYIKSSILWFFSALFHRYCKNSLRKMQYLHLRKGIIEISAYAEKKRCLLNNKTSIDWCIILTCTTCRIQQWCVILRFILMWNTHRWYKT